MYSGTHILVFLAFCNTYFYDIFVAGLHLFGGLIKKRIFCCYRFACALHTSFLFIQIVGKKNHSCFLVPLCEREIAVMVFGVCRLTFYYNEVMQLFYPYMLTGYRTKTRYRSIIKCLWKPHKYHFKSMNQEELFIMHYNICVLGQLHIEA